MMGRMGRAGVSGGALAPECLGLAPERLALVLAGLALLFAGLAPSVHAHTPSVSRRDASSPETAVVLPDPTLSRAIGATIGSPGEVDWYRLFELAEPRLIPASEVMGLPRPVRAAMSALGFEYLALRTVADEPGVLAA